MNEVTPKNNTMKIAVIILSILLVGSIGFIAYDKLIKKEEPKTEENNKQDDNKVEENNKQEDNKVEENNKQELVSGNYDLEEAKKLVDKYYYNWGDWGDTTFEKMDDNDKMYLSYVHLNKDELIAADCKKLYTNNSNATSNSDGRYNVNILNDEHVCDSESKFISYEKINDVYKSLFGNSNNIPKKAFGLGFDAFDYVDDGFVKLNFYGGGDWPTPYIMYDVLSAKLTNEDKLTISVGYVEFKIATDPETVYSADFDSSITYNDIDSIEKDFVKKHSDKITKLEFNFKKENENFVLDSLTKK